MDLYRLRPRQSQNLENANSRRRGEQGREGRTTGPKYLEFHYDFLSVRIWRLERATVLRYAIHSSLSEQCPNFLIQHIRSRTTTTTTTTTIPPVDGALSLLFRPPSSFEPLRVVVSYIKLSTARPSPARFCPNTNSNHQPPRKFRQPPTTIPCPSYPLSNLVLPCPFHQACSDPSVNTKSFQTSSVYPPLTLPVLVFA